MKNNQHNQSHRVRAIFGFLILIVSFNLLGCSAAIRTEQFKMQSADATRNGSWKTLQCGEEQVQVPFQISSKFTLMGIIVPVFPVSSKGGGDFQVNAPSITRCPVIQQFGKNITGAKLSRQGVCKYDRHEVRLTAEMSIKAQTDTGQCTTKPFNYLSDGDWMYIPMITR